MKNDLKKGQLVFIARTLTLPEDESVVMSAGNEPVIYDHEEEIVLNGHTFIQWWFKDADGNDDYVQSVDGGSGAPRTVEEVFGFRPLI